MPKVIEFRVDGEPRPEPRARHGKGRTRHDSSADHWKASVRLAALAALGIGGHHGPYGETGRKVSQQPIWVPQEIRGNDLPVFPKGVALVMSLEFYMPRVEGNKTTEHTQKPDLDNLVKAVKDALGDWLKMGSIAWHDDCQVVEYVHCDKSWACDVEPPGVKLTVATVASAGASGLLADW